MGILSDIVRQVFANSGLACSLAGFLLCLSSLQCLEVTWRKFYALITFEAVVMYPISDTPM